MPSRPLRSPSPANALAPVVLVAGVIALLVAGCSGADSATDTSVPATSAATTTSIAAPETSTPVTTEPAATAPSSTSASTSTSTTDSTSASTSTTVAPAAALVLRPDGLGDAFFGTDPESVVGYVVAIIGAPTTDSGWVPAAGPFGVCPGSEVRAVTWGDLTLLFGDTSQVATGRRHFFHYEYGPSAGASVVPAGMVTASGVGVGTTLARLLEAHPDADVLPADEIDGPYFVLGDGLVGVLSGSGPGDVVRSLSGGIGCGE